MRCTRCRSAWRSSRRTGHAQAAGARGHRPRLRPWVLLRQEVGELLARSVQFFSHTPTKQIAIPATTWPVTSRELALLLAPLGYRKLSTTDGVLRGEAVGAAYPVFHNSWRDRRATHEVWVGHDRLRQDVPAERLSLA